MQNEWNNFQATVTTEALDIVQSAQANTLTAVQQLGATADEESKKTADVTETAIQDQADLLTVSAPAVIQSSTASETQSVDTPVDTTESFDLVADYQKPTPSIPEIGMLPPEVQALTDPFVPKEIYPDTRACPDRMSSDEAALTCELGNLTQNNDIPPPRVLFLPSSAYGYTNLDTMLTDPTQRPCSFTPDAIQYCGGTIVISQGKLPGFGSNSAAPILRHEYTHAIKEAEGNDLSSVDAPTDDASIFKDEQAADYGAGRELREEFETGQITQEDVDAAFWLFKERLGTTYDASHGTSEERGAAFEAGWNGDEAYLSTITHSSNQIEPILSMPFSPDTAYVATVAPNQPRVSDDTFANPTGG